MWSKGVKPVLSVTLASGRTIRATANHRLFTGSGWNSIAILRVGDRLAVAREFPSLRIRLSWTDDEIILLGHLVGDGSYLKHQPLRYTTASEENSKQSPKLRCRLGSTVKRHAGRGNWHQLVIGGNGNRWHANGVGAWLKGSASLISALTRSTCLPKFSD